MYTGDRYTNRLEVARSATASLITSLAANNKSADDDTVEISFMSFATRAHTSATYHNQWYKGNDMSGLVSEAMKVSKPSSDTGGTNWDDALEKAQTVAAGKAAQNEETYIVFVSDGNPTYYNDDDGLGGSGDSSSTKTVNAAFNEADKIKKAGYKFYGVGFMGAGDYMPDLCKRANGTSEGYYYSAKNQTALEQAFAEIVNSITDSAGYKNVVVTDNVTSLTSTNLKLVDGDAKGFTYTRSDGVEYTGPKATYADNTVTWNLGDEPLVSGVTYTVSFKVWPSQEAYDLIADLNNGTASYEKLDNDIKSQIKVESTEEGNSYSLKTNTADGNQVSYTRVDTKEVKNKPAGTENADGSIAGSDGYKYVQTNGKWVGTKETKGTTALTNPDPIPVVSSAITVEKAWEGEEGTGEVQLKLMKDGKDTGKTVTLSKGDNGKWQAKVYVAPGLKAGNKVLESGHDYTLAEVNGGYKYEFSATSCHPMLINSATEVKNSDGSACVLLGTNTKKSNLEITKTVTRDDNVTDNTLFTYKVTIKEKKGDDVWFSIGDGQNVISAENRVTGATAEEKDGEKTRYYYADSNTEITIKIKAGENIFFTNLAKGSEYSVEEVNIPSEYQLQKVVNQGTEQTAAKAEGTISANKTTYTVAYTNKILTPTEVTLQVTKKVQGKNADRAFTFSMELKDGDSTGVVMPTDKTAATDANIQKGQSKTVSFNNIKFTKPGTYTFKVKETNGTVPAGWSYDKTEKTITVVVRNDNGELVATADGNNPEIVNSYSASPVTNFRIPVKKSLTGTGANTFDISNAFTFTLEGKNGAPMPETTTITNPDSNGGTASFGDITYTEAGTYEYKVKESGTVDGIENDANSEKTVTVTVVDNDSGQLVASIAPGDNITEDGALKFTNKVIEPIKVPLQVTKKVEGRDATEAFTFSISQTNTNAEGADGVVMPNKTTATTSASINKDQSETVTFDKITFTKPGTYTFNVKETNADGPSGWTYDNKVERTITVVVSKTNGVLSPEVKNGNPTFTNKYSASAANDFVIPVEKVLEGTGAPDITGKYTFTLTGKDGAPMPTVTQKTNPDSDGGTVEFGPIEYTSVGTYEYTVKETGSVAHITNDSNATKEVTVVVKDNNGKLSAVVNSDETLTFTNTYEPEAVSVDLEVTKVLENMKLEENQFTFQLLDDQDKSNAVQRKQNAADGTVAFEPLSYNYPGVYNYTIKEVIPDDAGKVKGVTYDNHEVKVTVTVTDTDGKLSATVKYEGDQTFTNTYNASGKSAIVGLKTLEGKTLEAGKYTFKLEGKNGAPMPAKTEVTNDANGYVNFGEINFKLSDLDTADEDKSDEDGSEGKTEGDSTVEDGSQETAAVAASEVEGADDVNSDENKEEDATVPRTKTFTYTVTEVAGSETGITYDTTPQEFTITVTDDGEGGLTVTTNPPTGEQNAPLFTIKNVYTPAKATIGVTKAFIDGRTGLNAWDEEKYADEEFEFELKAVGNAPLNPVDSSTASRTVTTSATSSDASFGIYEFDEVGTYEYTITEKNTGSGDVEYDTAPHKVKVVVTEDETTHQLSADVKYDDTEESLTVINRLKPADNARLNVVKHVVNTNGQPLSVNGEFHVALFSDKALKHRVSAVKTLEFNGSDPTAKVPFDVTPGRTYYVAETDADGKALGGAQKFDDQLYYICFGDPSGIEDVTDYPQYGEAAIPDSGTAEDVVFSNIFDGSKFMILGSITINKEVKIGKETKAVDGSFYVTAEYSQGNSDTIEKQTVELKVKDGKTQQPETISNLPTNTEITLKETDANGDALKNSVYNPIFTYGDESGETLKVTLTEEDSDIDVNLVNSEKLIDVAFDLKWDDYKNRDNTRDEYAVTLYANGVEVKDSTMTFSYDVTEGKWTDLRQYDDDGNEIVYSVKQTVVPENYSSNTDGTEFGLAPDVDDGIVHLIDVYRAVTITKKVTDSTGKAIKYNGDFYVTMFADPEGKEIAMDPVKITLDNEKSKTVIIPVPANTLYYLAETDEDGNKVDSSFEFIPTFSSTIAEVTDDAVSIVLTNEAKAGTPVDDPDNDSDTKTGDSANLMLMLLALLTSMLIGIVIILRGRRREN